MKIAVDARPLSIPGTGIGRYCRELLSRLTCSSHEWYLYSDRPFIGVIPQGPNITFRCGSIQHRMFSTPYAQFVFPYWARMDAIELFWSPRHHLPLMLPPTVKQVVTIHDLVWKRHPETMTRFGCLLERCLMPRSVSVAARVISPSNATANEVIAQFGLHRQDIEIIPEAANMKQHKQEELALHDGRLKKPYLLFVGTLEPRKNLRRTLQAYAKLIHQKKIAHHFFLVGGNGWGEENVEHLIDQLNLVEFVTVLGRVSDEELCCWYANADVLLMPSLYEGFGLPLLEAMVFGVPVITANSSSMPEVAGEAGLLVDPANVDDIQQAIYRLCSDRELRRELSGKAIIRAQQYSWDNSAEKTLQVLESVIAG